MTTHRRTVLLAEDHDDSREMLAVMLEIDGYAVVRAADGIQALRLARSSPPDLVITDVHMPLLNGIELIRALRKSTGGLASVPILAISAHGSSLCLEARDAGANVTIAKPLAFDRVRAAVTELVGGPR